MLDDEIKVAGLDARCWSLSCEELSTVGKRVWQSSALVSPPTTLNTDLTPSGDDIAPIEAPREDVEMGNEGDEEPLEEEIPKVRMNPKNPTSREKREHEDSGHAVYRRWYASCVEGRGSGQHRIELWEEEERKRTTPTVAFDYGFTTQKNADTFPILIRRDSKCGQRERLVGNGNVLQHTPHHFLQHEISSRCSDSRMCGSGSDYTGRPPEGDIAVREVKRQCRTLRISAEQNTCVRTAQMTVRYSAGFRWREPMAQFGEKSGSVKLEKMVAIHFQAA